MPPVSKAQTRAMYAAKEGNSTLGIPKSVGAEFTKDVPKNLPEHVKQAQGKLGGRDAAAHQHATTDTY